MPQFVTLGDPFQTVISDFGSAQQWQRRQEEEARERERQRQRQLLTTGLAAAAGAGVGLLAAPALGLAGGVSTASGISSVPFAGPLGSAGVLSGTGALTAGLTGAALGANVAQGLQSGDLAGPLGMAAGVVNQALTDKEEREVYGYNPSPAEKAAFAQAAVRAGTNLGSLRELAQRQGISLPEALQQTQQSFAQQEAQNEIYQAAQIAGAQTHARLQAERLFAGINDLDRYGFETVPDTAEIAKVQNEFAGVQSNLFRWFTSGGRDGRPPEEMQGTMQALEARLGKAAQGKKVPKGPRATYIDGTEHPVGSAWIDEQNGLILRAVNTKDGPQVEKVGDALKKPKPVRIGLGGGNVFESMDDAGVLPDGRPWERTSEGVKIGKPDQTPRQKLIESLAVDKDGVERSAEQIADVLGAVETAEQVLKDREAYAQELVTFAQTPGPVPPEAAAAIADRAVMLFGENPPMKVRDAVAAIDMRAKQTAQAIQQAAQPPPPPPAPPGSAAAAEQAGRGAAKAIKAVPGAAVKAATGVVKAAGKTAERVGSAGVGFAEEMLGIDRSTPEGAQAARFAQIQKQNIEAGIDETVTVIRPDGAMVPVIKGTLTPERIAEFKRNGFTIPGLD